MKAIDVLNMFPNPGSFKSVYYCPEHPDAEIKENVRWTGAFIMQSMSTSGFTMNT